MIDVQDKIFKSLKLRPNLAFLEENLLKDIIADTLVSVSAYLNLKEKDKIPPGAEIIVKDLVIIAINKMGDEGLVSSSRSSVSQSYSSDIPGDILRKLRRFRKLP